MGTSRHRPMRCRFHAKAALRGRRGSDLVDAAASRPKRKRTPPPLRPGTRTKRGPGVHRIRSSAPHSMSEPMVNHHDVSRTEAGGLVVRPAKEADVSEIAYLWTDVFVREQGIVRLPWSESDVSEAAATGDIFVAEHQERVIGAVALVPHGAGLASITRAQESQVLWLAVEQSGRRSGVAVALMEKCAAYARNRGDAAMVLWTRSSMGPAQSLYERLGYVRTPERDRVPGRGHQLAYRLGL
jgi:ribosomal protein S18 acetylase RimI-like enzyme